MSHASDGASELPRRRVGPLARDFLIAAALLVTGCGGGSISAGAEGGHCYPNSTCNDGLTCLSTLCVRLDSGAGGASGSAGTTGAAGGSGGATAGAAGVAGSVGTAGSAGTTGQAGGDVSGTGGMAGDTDGGAIDAPDDASSDAGMGSDVVLVRRASCPPGPFAKPVIGQAKTVCSPSLVLRYPNSRGATWVGGQDAFYFSNLPANPTIGTATGNIIKYTPGGTCEIAFPDVGTQGLAVTPEGRLIGASYKTRTVSDYDLGNGYRRTIIDMAMGTPLDLPIDVAVHGNGTIYFTNRTSSSGPAPRLAGGVYRIDPLGAVSNVAPGGACCFFQDGTGGVALSPDDKTLYVRTAGTWDLDAGGAPTAHRVNVIGSGSLGGVAVDCAGNIYMLSGQGAGQLYSPTLQPIGQFPGGTDLAFGGADGMTLLVVSGPSVAAIPVSVPGLP